MCTAQVNEPCRSLTNAQRGESVGYTHYHRRDAAHDAGHRNSQQSHMIIFTGSKK